MHRRIKDRIVNLVLILFFVTLIAGSAYFIVKVMTRWNVKGLG